MSGGSSFFLFSPKFGLIDPPQHGTCLDQPRALFFATVCKNSSTFGGFRCFTHFQGRSKTSERKRDAVKKRSACGAASAPRLGPASGAPAALHELPHGGAAEAGPDGERLAPGEVAAPGGGEILGISREPPRGIWLTHVDVLHDN